MCLAEVYLTDEEGIPAGEALMRDVARIELAEDGVHATDLMGNSKVLEATLRRIDFLDGTVLVELKNDSPAGADGTDPLTRYAEDNVAYDEQGGRGANAGTDKES